MSVRFSLDKKWLLWYTEVMLIDADTILRLKPCSSWYSEDRIRSLMDRAMTPVEILTRADESWSEVLAWHRLWVICRVNDFDDKTCRLILVRCARRMLSGTSNPVLHNALNVADAYAKGGASVDELNQAEERVWGLEWDNAASACFHATRVNAKVAFENFLCRFANSCVIDDIVSAILEGSK